MERQEKLRMLIRDLEELLGEDKKTRHETLKEMTADLKRQAEENINKEPDWWMKMFYKK